MAEEGLKKWFSRNKGKDGLTVKLANHVEENQQQNQKDHIQLAGLQKHNAQVLKKRKKVLVELVGKKSPEEDL